MFSFSNEDLNQGGKKVQIFNNGEAGVAKDVKITVLKKSHDYEDGPNIPDYKIRYTDAYGYVEMPYYYLTEEKHNPSFGRTFQESIKAQWQKLASIVQAGSGDVDIDAKNATEMLDQMMVRIKNTVDGGVYNVFANYGHKNNPKRWLQVRSWVPFIEATNVEATTLKETKIDQMERLMPDQPSSTSTSSGNSSAGWGVQ